VILIDFTGQSSSAYYTNLASNAANLLSEIKCNLLTPRMEIIEALGCIPTCRAVRAQLMQINPSAL